MSRTAVIRRRTVTALATAPVVRWIGAVLLALAVAATVLVTVRWQGQTSLVNVLIAVLGLIPPILATLLYVGGPLTRDLVTGTVTALMATPTQPRELTRGTTQALIELTWPLVMLTPMALILVRGDLGATPPSLVLVAFVLTPALGWGTAWLTVAVAVTKGVEPALAVTWLVGLLGLFVVPGGVVVGWFDVATWGFAAAYSVLVALVCLAVWALDASATRPRLAGVH